MKAPRSLKARALQWLAQREQSRSELRRKLLRVAVAADAAAAAACRVDGDVSSGDSADGESASARVDALLDWLQAHDFLSPERFVESRVHARSSRFGNLRIRQELKQHQVALPDDIARSLNDSELERARAVRARKFPAWPGDAAERAKQARYLAGRGFGFDAISRAVRVPADDEPPFDR